MATPKILIVGNKPALVTTLSQNLQAAGYAVLAARDGPEAIRQFQSGRPDLVLLSVGAPISAGWKLCTTIRETGHTPIILLAAQGREEEVAQGLALGANDYLTAPFRTRILLARIRSHLYRGQTDAIPFEENGHYADDYLTVDLAARRVAVRGENVALTPTEYRLLAYLVAHRGQTLESRQILENVWGFACLADVDKLRVYIWHLRRKLEPDPKQPVYLRSQLGVGYSFAPATD
jgi:DNA-binding response OmpR family regulator